MIRKRGWPAAPGTRWCAARRHRFVIVDQAAVEDTRLSWAARDLLAYLLSRPDD